MPKNEGRPPSPDSSPDEQWRAFIAQHSAPRAAPAPEPEPPAPRPARVWPRNAAVALLAAGAAFGVMTYAGGSSDGDTPASASASVSASAAASASATPSASTPASAPADAVPAAAARPMIPLDEVFPATVEDGSSVVFSKVDAVVLDSCTATDSVGARLAALIRASAGCVGEQIALYRDEDGNQYNLAVFTMNDPVDTADLVMELAHDFEDYQVAAQAPPPESGLPVLPADSGLVQAFGGGGRAAVIALGQWADGRTADYQELVERMGPLQDAVQDKAFAYEQAG
ncbi:hypothetical protein OG233_05250 [Streptomyces sp. NBC_01218]|uniref:hypothetical protein n=1 Tax=unclassified Streptomyces TaxID=2593676 RepID=UPI0023B9491C|nr:MULTISPECIES: hypothetical protein [unclassified Streptomyces]WEH38964.1 hypothetical protein PZB77_05260 [Streptomyces sp. AM 2-1-1]WSQ50624.1 hypothetical protein OG233_05250 [Streptomyces sp. NBC_01218]